MCIRDSTGAVNIVAGTVRARNSGALGRTNGATVITQGGRLDVNGISPVSYTHLTLADERSSVDLGGRRIIKKKIQQHQPTVYTI